ncbi:MAG: RsmE family RNA methyltransferase, partial [Gemmatimonadales bacterium]
IALAERCTELGVTLLVPLVTERARHVANGLRGAALQRARRRALEACKQCRRAWATTIDDPCELTGLAHRAPVDRWLLAHRVGVRCPELGSGAAVGWIVGPEGGLTEEEAAWCTDRVGAMPVGFGRAVLRFDTAAIAAAVLTADRRSAPEE